MKKENRLAVFDPMKAEVAKWKEINDSLEFDYETPQGSKNARSHIYKLRGTKSSIAVVHKAAKAEALAHCKAVDAEKNWLIGEVEGMISVHTTPLRAIEERERKAEAEKAEAERLEKERIEQERLAAIQKREEEATRREAKVRADEEATQRVERERQAKIKADETRLTREREQFEADKKAEAEARQREKEAQEQAEKQAEFDKKAAIKKAELDKIIAINEERERVRKEAEAKEAEEKRLAEVNAKRIAKKKHQRNIENEACAALTKAFGPDFRSRDVVQVISEGHIPHITLNY